MIEKAKNIDNFVGCLSWTIPFNIDVDFKKVEEAFKILNLEFDLYVYLSGIAKDEYHFVMKNSKSF